MIYTSGRVLARKSLQLKPERMHVGVMLRFTAGDDGMETLTNQLIANFED